MFRALAFWFTFVLLAHAAMADNGKIRVRFQIFIMHGSLLAETELQEPFSEIWDGDDDEWHAIQDSVELLDRAHFYFGNHVLSVKENGCHWDSTPIPFDSENSFDFPIPNIRKIYSPIVEIEENDTTRIKISSEQSLEYFKRNENGTYDLKTLKHPTGLHIKLRTRERHGRIYFDELWMGVRFVKYREALAGVSLPVGKPVIDTSEYTIEMWLRENKVYGVLLRLENSQGFVLICFDADE